MDPDRVVREQLLSLLRGGHSHMGFERAIAGFPVEHINRQPLQMPYTPWRLLEHVRIAQWDILEFIRNADYTSRSWPEGYWPAEGEEADELRWQETIDSIRADSQALQAIVEDPGTDLYAALPHGEEYNVLREILIVADHNSYHLGEFALLREVLGTWPGG